MPARPIAAARTRRLALLAAGLLLAGTLYGAVAQAASAADVPLWPPATRVSVTPGLEGEAFQPAVPDSNEELVTMSVVVAVTWRVAVEERPAVSVTVSESA